MAVFLLRLALACALLGFALPGAASARSSVSPSTVRLCVSVPGTELAELSVGVYHAVLLAVERVRPQLARVGIRLASPVLLDYGGILTPQKEVSNAYACIRRPDTVGFIGPINSGVALSSEPILNRAGLVTISPANTNAWLTDPRLRKKLEPATYAHAIPSVTYFRTVPSDAFQGGGRRPLPPAPASGQDVLPGG
jgi:branched-chain amino acid transport system substrate-binding protein